MKYLFLLLFPLCVFSQDKPLSFQIDSVRVVDSSATNRIYTVKYHIKNRSGKPVSFVLNTKRSIPIQRGSQSELLYFKIFENETAVDMEKILEGTFKRVQLTSKTYTDKTPEEVEKIEMEERLALFDQLITKSIMENIIKLAPNETRNFQTELRWDRQHYRKEGDIEYYINESNPYYLELAFNLLLEKFEGLLSEENYKILSSDPTIIKGWYTSNRVRIDFSE